MVVQKPRRCGPFPDHVRNAVPGSYLTRLVVLMLLGGCHFRATPIQSGTLIACGGRFEATVRQGPSAGLSLMGDLVLRVEPSGRANAVLTLRDRSEIKATGQVNGQAINLIFVVRPDTYIFGVGTLQHSVPECAGVWGGPFVGPELGDIGDWFSTNITPRS
jgi:hypothetical protein